MMGFLGIAALEAPRDGYVPTWSVALGRPKWGPQSGGGGGSVPTGTGFVHVTAGVQDGVAVLVSDADISASANIALSKLATIADQTILGNNTGGTGVPVALSAAQTRTVLGLATIATSASAADLSTGTLLAARMPALTGDITTTVGTVATTIGANKVTSAMLRQSAALSVIGNTTNATANAADIAAGTDGHILRRSGTSIGFGTIDASMLAAGTLAAARLPALTGDITTTVGTVATTLATVNSNVGTFTNATITVDAKGRITAASSGTGGSLPAIVSKTANYTATSSDYTILCDASGGAFTITLPAVASSSGLFLIIKKTDSSTNTVTVDGNLSETIDLSLTKVLNGQFQVLALHCNGSAWYIV